VDCKSAIVGSIPTGASSKGRPLDGLSPSHYRAGGRFRKSFDTPAGNLQNNGMAPVNQASAIPASTRKKRATIAPLSYAERTTGRLLEDRERSAQLQPLERMVYGRSRSICRQYVHQVLELLG
jgi:hypothetical protein